VIYAFGTLDPLASNDIMYHGKNRGSKKINLISFENDFDQEPSDSESIEFSINNVS
jgi:hypothetical protein